MDEFRVGSIPAKNAKQALIEARRTYNKKLSGNARQTVSRVRLGAKGDYLPELGRRGYNLYIVFVRIVDLKTKPEILTIEEDSMGCITITSNIDSGSVFLQFEGDKELIYDLLRKGERKDLDNGWKVQIKGNEPRASIIGELWDAQNGIR